MTEKYPFVSVIIPTYNRSKYLIKCLDALLALNYPRGRLEIIVVDDASCDETPRILSEYQEKGVIAIRHDLNTGPAGARNTGIRASKGEIIAFIDDDCIVDKNWIKNTLKNFKKDNQVAGVGGPSLTPPNSSFFEKAIGLIECRPAKSNLPITYRLGAGNAAYKREVLIKVGGFDESFKRASEDTELTIRLHKLGYKLVFDEKKRVYHKRPSSFKAYWKKFLNYGYMHPMLFRKHPTSFVRSGEFLPPLMIALILTSTVFAIFAKRFIPLAILLGTCLLYICLSASKIIICCGVRTLKYLPLILIDLVIRNLAEASGFYIGFIQFIRGRFN